MRRYRSENLEITRAIERRRYSVPYRVAQRREWQAQNRDYHRRKSLEWARAHPEKMAEAGARRRAQTKSRRDPRVVAVYFIARWLRDRGDDVHVDHIVPLCAGGQHVYSNLRIIPALENRQKGRTIAP